MEHHIYIPELSLPVPEAKSWRPEIAIFPRGRNCCGTMSDKTVHKALYQQGLAKLTPQWHMRGLCGKVVA